MNRFLPLLATQIPTLWIHTSWGGSSDIRSMSSMRPICKCRCPALTGTLLHHSRSWVCRKNQNYKFNLVAFLQLRYVSEPRFFSNETFFSILEDFLSAQSELIPIWLLHVLAGKDNYRMGIVLLKHFFGFYRYKFSLICKEVMMPHLQSLIPLQWRNLWMQIPSESGTSPYCLLKRIKKHLFDYP